MSLDRLEGPVETAEGLSRPHVHEFSEPKRLPEGVHDPIIVEKRLVERTFDGGLSHVHSSSARCNMCPLVASCRCAGGAGV